MNKLYSTLVLIFVSAFLFASLAQDTAQGTVQDTTQIDDSIAVTDSLVQEETIKTYKIGDISDGSKAVPVHLIKLYDHNGFSIFKDDEYLQPFSTKYTCGDCHTYEYIKDGTHFSIDVKDTSGHLGEPYIYTDYKSLTLLPLTYREWEGTFRPDSVGLTPFSFLKNFGSHFTGGNISENEDLESEENFLRWQVSGKLEINCLVCHDVNPEYDQAEFAKHIRNENFKWAASGASNLAEVSGFASKMPDNFDPYNTNTFVDVDLRTTPPPSISYDNSEFDENNKVFFDIEKRIDNQSCRFCHNNALNDMVDRHLVEQEDVHLSAGLLCVDCHKNGMDHKIIAGYEEEHLIRKNEHLYSYSCEGCHLSNDKSQSGNYGAPIPKHEGIPAVHFERLSCTVCHSGYMPAENAKLVKTARAHKLGVPGPNKMPSTFPLIQSPVYVESSNGKIEPRNLVWPSFWGIKDSISIEPLKVDFVSENIKPLLGLDSLYNFGEWPGVEDSTLAFVLDTLQSKFESGSKIVFVTGGNYYELGESNNLIKNDYEEAQPYSWPIAHNVRPAQQSLGINGCEDCHSLNSDFYFADVSVVSSISSDDRSLAMVNFQGLNTYYESLFSLSFFFRPILKFILILSTILITLVALTYLFNGIRTLSEYYGNINNDDGGDKI